MRSFYKKYSPDPTLERKDYEFLCGEWDFAFAESFDDEAVFDKKIIVPFSYECAASGIGDETPRDYVFYRRKFNVKKHDGSALLHFEGVDYHCRVYVNKTRVCEHKGGYTKFCVDVTDFVTAGENLLEVRVFDGSDKAQMRGKQRVGDKSYECWYVQTTGIWKPVWIEYAGSVYVKELSITANDDGAVKAEIKLNKKASVTMTVTAPDGLSQTVASNSETETQNLALKLKSVYKWSFSDPKLYNVEVTVDGEVSDKVRSYFGICRINVNSDGMYVNGNREYQRMILDQGYWRDTMLSAPDDEALEKDIDLIKAMGFNGVRIHQKVENALFYYLCDKKGLYVWGEIPSCYEFGDRMREEFTRDSELIFNDLKKHVCVVCWLLFNETWGVYAIKDDIAQQNFVTALKGKFKTIDQRPIITNDGWSHLDSDILSLHEYEQDAEVFAKEYSDKGRVVSTKTVNTNKYGTAFADGYSYRGQPIFISEYGGIALNGCDGWGYGDHAADKRDFEIRLRKIVGAVKSLDYVSGCCYTQFVDTQQEKNGLLYEDRTPKLPLKVLNEIFG